jgi:hypothetical protein
LFLSTDDGASWMDAWQNLPNPAVRSLAVSGTSLFVGSQNYEQTAGGVFRSTDDGNTWTSNGLTGLSVFALAVSGTNLFAGTMGGGVFLSTDDGASWTEVDAGLTDSDVRAFAISVTDLFVGTSHGGVWRRPLSEMITSVEMFSSDLPAHFSLDQSYPNPGNPGVTIQFFLPRSGFVTLKVFNVLGEELATLVNENLVAGRYHTKLDATNFTSGVYFYRLQAGKFSETKKLILIK